MKRAGRPIDSSAFSLPLLRYGTAMMRADPKLLALTIAFTAGLGGCDGPGESDGASPATGDEQAALEKAEAMIEENPDRLGSERSGGEATGSKE